MSSVTTCIHNLGAPYSQNLWVFFFLANTQNLWVDPYILLNLTLHAEKHSLHPSARASMTCMQQVLEEHELF